MLFHATPSKHFLVNALTPHRFTLSSFRIWTGALLLMMAPAAFATSSIVFSNTNVGAPTSNLPQFGSTSGSCSVPAPADPLPYKGLVFTPNVTGTYTFTITNTIETIPGTDDTVTFVYSTSFNPNSTCTNFVDIGNETPGTPLQVNLTAGTQYILIVAGLFGSEDDFSVTISNNAGNAGAFGNNGTVLPVTMTSFTAEVSVDDATLRWEMVNEINNEGWEVEEQVISNGTTTWKSLGFVEGAGTSAETHAYQFKVGKLIGGQHTFRLKQRDRDGRVSYSRPIQVWVEFAEAFSLAEAYPNPFNPQTRFQLSVMQDQRVKIHAYDLQGRRVATIFDGNMLAATPQTFTFEAGNLASGLYLITLEGAQFRTSMRVQLVK